MLTYDDTLDQFVSTVRRFVRDELIPAEREVEETDRIPEPIAARLKELGFFGLAVPQQYGGLGLSMFDEATITIEVAYASIAFRAYFGPTNGPGTLGLASDGTDEQRQAYLPRLARGDLIAAFCLTEPDTGSDAAALSTSAVRDGDHYVLNGTKRFVSNAPNAGLFFVFARTGAKDSGAGGVSAFLIERGTPGLTMGTPYDKMGLRGTQTADMFLENCRVPATHLLSGREGTGFKIAMKALDHGRIHMSSVAVGQSLRLIDEARRYATQRQQFGRPIAKFQLIQAMLADCETEALAARAVVERTARMMDDGGRVTKEAACCKYFATEALGRIADRVLQIHGAYGYIKEYPVEHMFRDARILRIFEGTSQILQLIIARESLREFEAS